MLNKMYFQSKGCSMLPQGGLTRRIISEGLLDSTGMQNAASKARENNQSLISFLGEQDNINQLKLMRLIADEFGLPLLNLKSLDLANIPSDLVDPELISKYRVLPLHKRNNTLSLATSDPTDIIAIDDIKFHTGMRADFILVDAHSLNSVLEGHLDQLNDLYGDNDLGDLDAELLEESSAQESEASAIDLNDSAVDEDDTPVVKFVYKMLMDAIKGGASDIHFEPYEKTYRIRYRTDGILHTVAEPPASLAGRLSARIKIISKLNISERRVPQDGRIKLKLTEQKAIDFRVNTLPTIWGEKIVLRILDPTSAQLGIDALGYAPDQKKLYLDNLSQPQGLILVTGPTGSGKTVSLYTGLNILNTEDTNISTAEDPVEINLTGINQVHINEKVGLNFSGALRAFLRQDPDVIMVGEIRDLDTANIAIKAAQTGHLVLSTLHTNSAADTVNRLMNMGVPSFNLATSVSLIIAQRLARKLCAYCKVEEVYPKEVLLEQGFREDELDDLTIMKPVGCEKCNKGYKGRSGIFEVVEITPPIADLIMNNGNAIQINTLMRKEGFDDLRRNALKKAKIGEISLEELNRVTQD
jgi:type IV pilus assembly protein PilB